MPEPSMICHRMITSYERLGRSGCRRTQSESYAALAISTPHCNFLDVVQSSYGHATMFTVRLQMPGCWPVVVCR